MLKGSTNLALLVRRSRRFRTIARAHGILNITALEASVHENQLTASFQIINGLFHNQSATSGTRHKEFPFLIKTLVAIGSRVVFVATIHAICPGGGDEE
jgi:hypothetical protein